MFEHIDWNHVLYLIGTFLASYFGVKRGHDECHKK